MTASPPTTVAAFSQSGSTQSTHGKLTRNGKNMSTANQETVAGAPQLPQFTTPAGPKRNLRAAVIAELPQLGQASLTVSLLVFVCLWVLPRVANWFFVRVGRTRPQRFVFTLALMAVGATVALLGGMEGLIGAFLAGLGLNRLVPARGPLMERLDFVGTSLFIPVFLISIGLNIDPAVLIDPQTVGLGVLFTGFVLVGKTTAAAIAGRVFGLSGNEVGLMSSLSFGEMPAVRTASKNPGWSFTEVSAAARGGVGAYLRNLDSVRSMAVFACGMGCSVAVGVAGGRRTWREIGDPAIFAPPFFLACPLCPKIASTP